MVTGTTTLVSVGEAACAPACGNGAVDAGFAGASSDGTKVFFVSEERLAAADTDNSVDIYVRDLADETTAPGLGRRPLLCAGLRQRRFRCGPARHLRRWLTCLLHHRRVALGADTDSAVDIYSRNLTGETTTLVSQGGEGCAPACGNSGAVPVFQGSSARRLAGLLHHRRGRGRGRQRHGDRHLRARPAEWADDADLRRKFLDADRQLRGGHSRRRPRLLHHRRGACRRRQRQRQRRLRVERRHARARHLRPAARAPAARPSTRPAPTPTPSSSARTEQLAPKTPTAASTSTRSRSGAARRCWSRAAAPAVACGNGAFDARFDRASADASHVVFTSAEVLSPEDGDAEDDIYARDVVGGETSLVTTLTELLPAEKRQLRRHFRRRLGARESTSSSPPSSASR